MQKKKMSFILQNKCKPMVGIEKNGDREIFALIKNTTVGIAENRVKMQVKNLPIIIVVKSKLEFC